MVELVRQIVARQDRESRARWLAELLVEFKPKCNFIASLPSSRPIVATSA
jgi:hypothetical protein